jgi:DNA invertase Pin-like site-specific DNA recombinase
MLTKGADHMNSNTPYGYTPNEQGTSYQINPGEAAEVRRLFEQAATKGVAIYMRTNDPGKETAPKYAAIYARVATVQEPVASNGLASYGLEAQINACKAYCEQHGYALRDIYQETYSGAQLDRPMLNALRQAIHDRQIHVLVVWDFTRLARRMILQAVILRECYEAGITIESVQNDQFEGDVARFITMAHEYMAEVETERRRIRARSRKAAASQQKAQQQ